MPKSAPTPNTLEQQLAAAAETFVREVLALVGRAAPDDVLSLDARRITPNLVDGVISSPSRRRRRWPTCGEKGCGNSYYPASGTARQCYEHFLQAGGKHPSKRRGDRR